MAKTFSRSANDYIDKNAKGVRTTTTAEMAVNIAVRDVIDVVRTTLIQLCPHQEICGQENRRNGCDFCPYLNKYMVAIKSDKSLCYNNEEN